MIVHFCPRTVWQHARAAGRYTADSLATQGYIHCSTPDSVHLSATLLARGRTDLVLLEIDETGLPVVWEQGEPPAPDGRLFPHLYGPLPVMSVVAVRDFPPEPDGSFAPRG